MGLFLFLKIQQYRNNYEIKCFTYILLLLQTLENV